MSEKNQVLKNKTQRVYQEKVKQFGRVCAVRQIEPTTELTRVAEKNKKYQHLEIKRK